MAQHIYQIITHQNNFMSLPEMAYNLTLFPPQHSGQLTSQLAQGLQANIVQTMEFVLACGGPVHYGRLQSIDYGQVNGCGPASCGTIRNVC